MLDWYMILPWLMKRIFQTPTSIFLLLALYITSCESENPSTPTETDLKPSIQKIEQVSNTKINIQWKRASADKDEETVRVVNAFNLNEMKVRIVLHPQDTAFIEGLTLNNTYIITVAPRGGKSDSRQYTLSSDSIVYGKPIITSLKQNREVITLTWRRDPNDVTSDTVYVREKLSGNLLEMRVSALTVEEFTGFTIGTVYTFYVRSKDSGFDSTDILFSSYLGKPSNVMLNTTSENSITARWTRSSDDNGTDTVVVIEPNGTEHIAKVFAGTTIGTVGGLSTGKLYKVQVASQGGRSPAIEWATAIQTRNITLYETVGSLQTQPNGVALSYNGGKAQALSINDPDSLKIDLVLATDPTADAAGLSLQGANVIGSQIPTGKSAQFSDTVFIVEGGLAADFYPSGFSSRITAKRYFDQFNSKGGSAIVLVKTMEGNYARIEVIPQADGKLFRMVGSVKAIDLVVSYQPLVGKAYASRPIKKLGETVPKRTGEGARVLVKN
jgi:hypothetical protein